MRVWIEMSERVGFPPEMIQFHPLMRVWIEIGGNPTLSELLNVSPSYEGVD